ESHFLVAREESLDDLRIDRGVRVLFDAVPDVEQENSALLEHAVGLPERRLLVGNEHDPEGTDHRTEFTIAEWQFGRIGLAPFDIPALAQFPTGIVQHRNAQVRGNQPYGGVEPFAQPSRHQAGPASDLQNIARRLGRAYALP